MSTIQLAKGVRDFSPKEKIIRDKIISIFQETFELFGFLPLETPIIERYETLASKYGAGIDSDVMKESFKLNDNGGRNLVLRNEFTVPFARYLILNPNTPLPFKRYQICPIFRDGPIKLGRYREFYQCDIDIAGTDSLLADAEIIEVVWQIFQKLNLDIEIKINNRKILNAILEQAEIEKEKWPDAITAIDKFDKIGAEGVKKELIERNIDLEKSDKVVNILNITSSSNSELIEKIKKILSNQNGIEETEKTLSYLPDSNNIVFQPCLARGQGYYTGNVFEVYLKDKNKISSSLAGGGRYDNLVGGLAENNKNISAVGVGFGLETILDSIDKNNFNVKNIPELLVVVLGEINLPAGLNILRQLRQQNKSASIYYNFSSLKKALKYANDLGAKEVVIIGDDEVKSNKILVKNMLDGTQAKIDISKY